MAAVLSDEDVAAIRWSYAREDHPTQRELARRFDVNPSTISRIVTGKAWVRADGPTFLHPPKRSTR